MEEILVNRYIMRQQESGRVLYVSIAAALPRPPAQINGRRTGFRDLLHVTANDPDFLSGSCCCLSALYLQLVAEGFILCDSFTRTSNVLKNVSTSDITRRQRNWITRRKLTLNTKTSLRSDYLGHVAKSLLNKISF